MKSLTERVWEQLGAIRSLSLDAHSDAANPTGWTGKAQGAVEIQRPAPDCIHFVESGSWSTPAGKRSHFSNTYRWTRHGGQIRLEHLRLGPDRPVHLVDLVPDTDSRMVSAQPHVCTPDLYTATLELGDELKLNWSITGPRKKETIDCTYSTEESG